jgi:hypothetical protein
VVVTVAQRSTERHRHRDRDRGRDGDRDGDRDRDSGQLEHLLGAVSARPAKF